ncbi:hypothetical protein TWF694_011144 [Orbilia ellipsospora]|uniref:Annexin n=1 Tax=Orbilia ellipsospora TaxID=2528407 RepID=A0AAV9X877_9PEZI
MSYQQYPGGYGQPPPPNQFGGGGYQQPNFGAPQGYPPQGPPQGPQNYPPQQQQGGAAGSYYNPQSQPPPQGAPYGGQQGFPGPSGYPPQQNYNDRGQYQPPPPQMGGQYPPGPNAYPQGPGPSGYGAPPPNQYQQPPPQNYGGAPPYSAPSPYGGAPPYGAPPPQPYGNQYPQQQSYQPQFPGAHMGGHPDGPSPGYEDPPQSNAMEYRKQADALRVAMKGFGTDESELIRVIAKLQTPYGVHSVQKAFNERHGRDLLKDVKSETSGRFKDALIAVLRGPLLEEVYAVHDAIHRPGTTESVLNDVLLCRSPPDLDAIKKTYQRTFSRDLESDVRGDLSMKTENMFAFALQNRRALESYPVDIAQSEKDAYNIHLAMEGVGTTGTVTGGVFGGTHQETVYSTILSRNDAQIGAMVQSYERMYGRKLEHSIEKKFSGHMQQALLYAVRGGTNKARRDAMLLEDAMKGIGTKDDLLIHRIVKYRWNKAYFENVKKAYYELYKKNLDERVHGETSGDYRRFLVALILG